MDASTDDYFIVLCKTNAGESEGDRGAKGVKERKIRKGQFLVEYQRAFSACKLH
jgi:hypothetical protein